MTSVCRRLNITNSGFMLHIHFCSFSYMLHQAYIFITRYTTNLATWIINKLFNNSYHKIWVFRWRNYTTWLNITFFCSNKEVKDDYTLRRVLGPFLLTINTLIPRSNLLQVIYYIVWSLFNRNLRSQYFYTVFQ